MTADEPAKVTYSVIYRGKDAQYGDLIVCIRGIHNVQAPNFMPLEYEFEVMRWI